MTLHVIVGAQWGDEGKGRIVDWFASQAAIAARYNGGDNAGHSVTVGETLFKLHLVPSGIVHPHTLAVMGNGMVINPQSLAQELDLLSAAGVDVSPRRLRISYAAHLITPAHRALDAALEAARGKGNIGTTGRGIGPAYTDKAARTNLRLIDILSPELEEKLLAHLQNANRSLQALGAEPLAAAEILPAFRGYAQRFAPYIADTGLELHQALQAGQTVLAEGAQGSLLDIDHGTYPFVTSSTTLAPGVLSGLGLGLNLARQSLVSGVCKAFQTRVGSGPFPTEVFDQTASRLRGSGENPWDEFGTTTGRPRRVGWLDTILLRYAARLNGLDELILTKLDILSGLPEIRLCVAYQKETEKVTDLAFGPSRLEGCTPVYETLPGWQEDLGALRHWRDLPEAARRYIRVLEQQTGLPVRLVSVGPEREQMITVEPGV